jgi:hypothetical protein
MATRANRNRQRWTLLLAAVALAFVTCCLVFLRSFGSLLPDSTGFASVTPAATHKPNGPTEAPGNQRVEEKRGPHFVWYRLWSGKGVWDVTTELTIPGVCTDQKSVMPIRRYMLRDGDGNEQLCPWGRRAYYCCAVSVNGGPNLGGSLDLKESDEQSVLLSVSCCWSIPRDHIQGSLKENVRVEIGVPAELDFEGGCHLKVSWQRNADVRDVPGDPDAEFAD